MKLKTKFLLFSLVVHVLFICIITRIYASDRDLFLFAEVLILISLSFTIWMYRLIGRPSDIIYAGIESLKSRDFSMKLNPVGHVEMDELISVYNMMIEQLRQERLQKLEKHLFLEKLIEASPTAIIILDFDEAVDKMNPAATRLMGMDINGLKGKKIDSLPGKLAQELALLSVNTSKVVNLNGIKSFKCQRSTFVDRGFNRTFFTIEELTKEIYAREKAAYERVVKIMSHEVNNSIGAINSILNTCLNYEEQLHEDDRLDYKNALQISIDRNKHLSNLMSNFAGVVKVPEPELREIDLLQISRSIKGLMDLSLQMKELNWEWETEDIRLVIRADRQQMEQVLINVIKNAIEASPSGGTIRICANSDYISVSNTGPGISEEVSEQIFSPFFSTKKKGQGVGLMLTKEILMNHGFAFALTSKEGWTEFRISFS